MKKLTKMSLERLAETMKVIPEKEMERYWGLYDKDCFWRCVAYMLNGGESYDEPDAEAYALDFFTNTVFNNVPGDPTTAAHNYLSENGAAMDVTGIGNYAAYASSIGDYTGPSSLGYIAVFNTDYIDSYESTGESHAVIVRQVNPDGSLDIFDPQQATSGYIPAHEAQHVFRAMF